MNPKIKKLPGKLISRYIGKQYAFRLPGGSEIYVTVKKNEGMKQARERLQEMIENERFGKIEI